MQLVTSLGKTGFQQYGQKMLKSVTETLPLAVTVYTEDEITFPNVTIRRLQEVKGWQEFQDHTEQFSPQSFLYDARRFSHKVFALLDIFERGHRYIVWLDGDTVVKARFGVKFIKKLLKGKMCAHLGREGSYTETGFLAFDTWHEDFPQFRERYSSCYLDRMLFLLPFWTDCHAFDASRHKLRCQNLSQEGRGVEDVFSQSPLADFIIHNKGNRK